MKKKYRSVYQSGGNTESFCNRLRDYLLPQYEIEVGNPYQDLVKRPELTEMGILCRFFLPTYLEWKWW